MKELQRVEGFASGDFDCVKCGKELHLYYNGGELDGKTCCGLTYRTEHQRTDLIIEAPDRQEAALDEHLRELERTDPKVRAARKKYDQTVRDLLIDAELKRAQRWRNGSLGSNPKSGTSSHLPIKERNHEETVVEDSRSSTAPVRCRH